VRRDNVTSETSWEREFGYSRAVRVDRFVYVSGTTATDGTGGVVGVGDAYAQTVQSLGNIRVALRAAGAEMEDVVRTRIYVTDMGEEEKVARAHRETFEEVRPAATIVEVRRLISPELLVEVEAEAVLPEGR
jgi:enamine deaminase RidA (YjgF/YER057c/UK114 family)